MPIPKSVVRINKNGVEYVSNCDRVQYTLHELIRAALRDSCKLITKRTREKIKKKTGKGARNIQYWVRSRQKVPNAQVGIKPRGFYVGFQELGTQKQRKIGALSESTKENINEIMKITGKYISAIENENIALGLIREGEYEGE